jgi:hypothetical protein
MKTRKNSVETRASPVHRHRETVETALLLPPASVHAIKYAVESIAWQPDF